ncbi:hypothetical protein DA2_1188 [Desulfovibrio sp. A2]|nr:hypothetical protein DA2_1188 [Desulfovibrio sp. A2]
MPLSRAPDPDPKSPEINGRHRQVARSPNTGVDTAHDWG